MNVTIVIPVFNQLHFTQQCLESLNACGYADAIIVVVNNASIDGTGEFLASRPGLRVIQNAENRACAAAWNQGFQASRTRWTVFLNNDLVVARGWLENLIAFAEANSLGVASPAMTEGDLNYDLTHYGADFMARMKTVSRRDTAFGAAFMVARAVFEKVGGFDENFRRGGNEDDDFFMRTRLAGFKLAVSGGAYVHHFGSVTRRAIGGEQWPYRAETVGYFRQKWGITWAKRRWMQFRRKSRNAVWRWQERSRHGHTVREVRMNGKIYYW